MTKQEEIRKGIAFRYAQSKGMDYVRAGEQAFGSLPQECYAFADLVLKDEDSQGVVVKVERELPESLMFSPSSNVLIRAFVSDAGYGAVVPLIEEVSNG